MSFEEDVIVEKIDDTEMLMEKLSTLEDPHSEYTLLRSCFSLPKLSGQQLEMEELRTLSQKVISQAIEKNFSVELKEKTEGEREKARLNSVGLKHSGDWLNAVPVKASKSSSPQSNID